MSDFTKLNMTPGMFAPEEEIFVSQGDSGRGLAIILEEDGQPYEIPSGSTVKFVGTKPSGLGFQITGTYSGNIVRFETEETMTNEYGRIPCEIRITDANDKRIGSANTILYVEKDPHPDDTTDGDAEDLINQITALVQEATAQAEAAEEAAEDAEAAQEAAETARDAAVAAKTAAQTAQSGAETAKTAAETAKTAAQTAQSGAETAKTAAETASAAAQAAKTAAETAQRKAETAQTAAEAANTAAQEAKTAAQTAQTAAEAANTAAQAAKTAAEAARDAAEGFAEDSEAWAVGKRNGTDVSSGDETYNNNSKYYSQQSANSAAAAAASAQAAEAAAQGYKRYGVSGIGQSANALTRLYDAVGKVAQVGTDGDNTSVINNFDNLAPFNRRKCVGRWFNENGRAVFRVNAYKGDADYAEDGSMGDFVAVECPKAYYYMKDGELAISAHQYEGYRPFDIFCHDHNPNDLMDFVYLPAYALALKDGHAVSLPGLVQEQGAYYSLLTAARTYNNDSVKGLAMLQPMAVNFYEWAMATVEFATQNVQTIMFGCGNLRSANSDAAEFLGDTSHLLVTYNAGRVAGQNIAVSTSTTHYDNAYKATHKVLSVTRCDQDGTANASGAYQLLELQDLGQGYYTYAVGTTYYVAARPWLTGACNDVSTPSGSPVHNTNGYYPMKYRHRENVFGNQYKTIMDLFNKRVLDEGETDKYHLEWYFLPQPQDYTPASSSKPDATDIATDKFVKLGVETPNANYKDGWIKSKKYDEEYPDIWIPDEVTGASASTYFCDYAYLAASYAVRSVRLGGYWANGSNDGVSYVHGNNAPPYGYANYGGDLCFAQ